MELARRVGAQRQLHPPFPAIAPPDPGGAANPARLGNVRGTNEARKGRGEGDTLRVVPGGYHGNRTPAHGIESGVSGCAIYADRARRRRARDVPRLTPAPPRATLPFLSTWKDRLAGGYVADRARTMQRRLGGWRLLAVWAPSRADSSLWQLHAVRECYCPPGPDIEEPSTSERRGPLCRDHMHDLGSRPGIRTGHGRCAQRLQLGCEHITRSCSTYKIEFRIRMRRKAPIVQGA